MTDPFEALRDPTTPATPDPAFAARLRDQLTRAVLDQPPRGDTMTTHTTPRTTAWPPTLTPYIVVSDARAALAWYTEVLAATPRGEPHVNPDGTIGHMEIALGDAVLMFAEASDLWPDVPVQAPDNPTTFSHSLHLDVPDVDATIALARRRGATVQREPADQPYGRGATIVDPFGHRWLIVTPPPTATRARQGDIVQVTMVTPDATRTKTFYEAVLDIPFTTASVAGAWDAHDTNPRFGTWTPDNTPPQTELCFKVDDITAAADRVHTAGGTTGDINRRPYGLTVECVDDQGIRFQLWQPAP
ncbi:VOC family protein [Actinophytocola oryzae]|uniref:Putative glyoxalase superfamily protein PhnB n=1 Tax=Actinophytocola oryzae TaxID=502181 RepID=A0A4R7V405_9PSEU|nr:VOC family protein [Actinophytocola oryzae]TDV43640.1 putative glyoxalase superfamily protein PhnB [Actinophytocola oryzae]